MPYKSSDQAKQASRERMRKYREGVTKGVTLEGVTGEGVTRYPAIMYALTDPIKRAKLEKICQSLKDHHVLGDVRYGCFGPTFDVVSELLEVT